jgi:hypothetical protein
LVFTFPLLFTLNMFDSSSAINHLEYINWQTFAWTLTRHS